MTKALEKRGLALGTSWDRLADYVIYFFLYCVFGWLYEVFLEVVVYRWGFSNRGFLLGPYLPIYGVGALLFLLCLTRWKDKPLLVFLGSGLLATAIELLGSYLLEALTGGWLWNYTHNFANFQGRIALNPSVRFALGGLLFLYVLQPLFQRLTGRLSPKARRRTALAILLLILADGLCTAGLRLL